MCVSKVHLNFTQTDDCKLSAQLLDMKKYSKVFFLHRSCKDKPITLS